MDNLPGDLGWEGGGGSPYSRGGEREGTKEVILAFFCAFQRLLLKTKNLSREVKFMSSKNCIKFSTEGLNTTINDHIRFGLKSYLQKH